MSHLIRIYTVCHTVFDYRLKPLFAIMDRPKYKDGHVDFRNSGVKRSKVTSEILVPYFSSKTCLGYKKLEAWKPFAEKAVNKNGFQVTAKRIQKK